MGICKTQTACRKNVDIRSVDEATITAVTVDVTDAEIISQNENDVRLCRERFRRKTAQNRDDEKQATAHPGTPSEAKM